MKKKKAFPWAFSVDMRVNHYIEDFGYEYPVNFTVHNLIVNNAKIMEGGRVFSRCEYCGNTIMLGLHQVTVSKLKFSEVGPNGDTILSELIKNDILVDIFSTEVRLGNCDLYYMEDWIRDIAEDDFDKILDILQQSQQNFDAGITRLEMRHFPSINSEACNGRGN